MKNGLRFVTQGIVHVGYRVHLLVNPGYRGKGPGGVPVEELAFDRFSIGSKMVRQDHDSRSTAFHLLPWMGACNTAGLGGPVLNKLLAAV